MTADRSPSGAMATWLTADLQANTNQWTIAFWHHPPYSKGSHDSDYQYQLYEMRANIVPILESYGVDLVLSGHSHSYERSFLLNGHYGTSDTFTTNMLVDGGTGREEESGAYAKARGYQLGNRGAVYTVAGNGGQTSGGLLNHPAMCVSSNVLGSLLLVFNTNRLDEFFIRETGETNDHYTIIKNNTQPLASNLNFTVSANQSATLTLSGSDLNRDSLQFAISNGPTNGLLSPVNATNGVVQYTPARGFTSPDAFSFTVNDGQTSSVPGTVNIAILPLSDTNQNGLADSWEAQYGLTDPDGDPDHDGMTNLQEYRAGTNPLDNQSWLRVTAQSGSPAGYTLTWVGAGGVRYRVLYSDGNSAGGFNNVFTPIVRSVQQEMNSNSPGATSLMTFTDDFTLTGVPVRGVRYYRLQVLP
jgi:hypothetical protein